jgi:hypothetical protein
MFICTDGSPQGAAFGVQQRESLEPFFCGFWSEEAGGFGCEGPNDVSLELTIRSYCHQQGVRLSWYIILSVQDDGSLTRSLVEMTSSPDSSLMPCIMKLSVLVSVLFKYLLGIIGSIFPISLKDGSIVHLMRGLTAYLSLNIHYINVSHVTNNLVV